MPYKRMFKYRTFGNISCTYIKVGIYTNLGEVSHICVAKNSLHFPFDALMRYKCLYLSDSLGGWGCQIEMSWYTDAIIC